MRTREEAMTDAFGNIFLLAQRWQTMGDAFLGQWDLTTKQWLLLATIDLSLGGSARLGDAAEAYGSSYQNVKRIASDLSEKGLLAMEKDPEDKRALRLTITEKNQKFWEAHSQETMNYINRLFSTLSDREVSEFARIAIELNSHAENIKTSAKED